MAGNEAGKVMVWDMEAAKVAALGRIGWTCRDRFGDVARRIATGSLRWRRTRPSAEMAGISNRSPKIKISDETAWCVAYRYDGKNLLVGSSDRHLYRCKPKADAKPKALPKGPIGSPIWPFHRQGRSRRPKSVDDCISRTRVAPTRWRPKVASGRSAGTVIDNSLPAREKMASQSLDILEVDAARTPASRTAEDRGSSAGE